MSTSVFRRELVVKLLQDIEQKVHKVSLREVGILEKQYRDLQAQTPQRLQPHLLEQCIISAKLVYLQTDRPNLTDVEYMQQAAAYFQYLDAAFKVTLR